jgi:competence protein ComEC
MRRVTPHKQSHKLFVLLRLFIACVVLFLLAYTAQFARIQTPGLKVWFFDIGQGDAIFIETPNGQQILIDGGPGDSILQKLSSVMWPWDHSIDAIVITHPDADHITGLVSVFERYQVKTIYETGVRGGTPMIQALEQAIAEEQSQNKIVREGQTFNWDGVQVFVHWPSEEAIQTQKDRNNTSVVLKLVYGSTSILLTGDAEETIEEEIGFSVGDIDVLKVGHHGSKTSTSVQFLKVVNPEVAVIPVGADNSYGHPHPIVLEHLKQVGASILRTDLDGDILLVSDSMSYKVSPVFLPF